MIYRKRPPRNISKEERFRYYGWTVSPAGCWEWDGILADNGYGRITVGHKHLKAHRYSYELFIGPIPEGLWVLHDCDNRRCVNPEHLYAGTPKENARDMHSRGRAWVRSGAESPAAKLTQKDVDDIRKRLTNGETTRMLGEEYGVHSSTISRLNTRRRWK